MDERIVNFLLWALMGDQCLSLSIASATGERHVCKFYNVKFVYPIPLLAQVTLIGTTQICAYVCRCASHTFLINSLQVLLRTTYDT